MPLASPIAETFFELTPVYFGRAWGMTAKAAALPGSRLAGVAHGMGATWWEKSITFMSRLRDQAGQVIEKTWQMLVGSRRAKEETKEPQIEI
jgi:hypothetical protein